jgi:hypothetical protein
MNCNWQIINLQFRPTQRMYAVGDRNSRQTVMLLGESISKVAFNRRRNKMFNEVQRVWFSRLLLGTCGTISKFQLGTWFAFYSLSSEQIRDTTRRLFLTDILNVISRYSFIYRNKPRLLLNFFRWRGKIWNPGETEGLKLTLPRGPM